MRHNKSRRKVCIGIISVILLLLIFAYSRFRNRVFINWEDIAGAGSGNSEAAVQEAHVFAVCEAVKNMDFTIREPRLELTEEEDRLYKEAYLKVLKNEMPILEWPQEYYKDLEKAGIAFEKLLEMNDTDVFPYLFYYDDLDGDGKPEFGVNQGCLYIFDYELGEKGVRILYSQQSCYLKKILGVGQIWYQDVLHAGVARDRYIFLNKDNEWEECALDLERGLNPSCTYYRVGTTLYNQIDVGEENWSEITKPFFDAAARHEIPKKTLKEIFGELLEER